MATLRSIGYKSEERCKRSTVQYSMDHMTEYNIRSTDFCITVILVVEPTSELMLEGVLALVLSLLTPSSSIDSIRAFR